MHANCICNYYAEYILFASNLWLSDESSKSAIFDFSRHAHGAARSQATQVLLIHNHQPPTPRLRPPSVLATASAGRRRTFPPSGGSFSPFPDRRNGSDFGSAELSRPGAAWLASPGAHLADLICILWWLPRLLDCEVASCLSANYFNLDWFVFCNFLNQWVILTAVRALTCMVGFLSDLVGVELVDLLFTVRVAGENAYLI